MPNTKIASILQNRNSARRSNITISQSEVDNYNSNKLSSTTKSKLKITLRNNTTLELYVDDYLTLECYDEYDTFVSSGIVYFGDYYGTISILGLIDLDSILDDNGLTISDITRADLILYSRRGLSSGNFHIYGIDSYYLASTITSSGEYIVPLLDIYDSDYDTTFFIEPDSSFYDYDIIYDFESIVEVDAPTPISIFIDTPPTKTTYYEGETFNPTNMVVKATFTGNITRTITNYTYYTGELTSTTTQVAISYLNLTTNQPITVIGVSSIFIDTPPTKTIYYVGESFNSGGMVVKVNYPDGYTRVVSSYSVSPMTLSIRDNKVTISKYNKSVNQSVFVRNYYTAYNNSFFDTFIGNSVKLSPYHKSALFEVELLNKWNHLIDINMSYVFNNLDYINSTFIYNHECFKLYFDERLIIDPNSTTSIKHLDNLGLVHIYTKFDDGTFTGTVRYYEEDNAINIIKISGNNYILETTDYIKTFNSLGFITSIKRKLSLSTDRIIFSYNEINLLDRIYNTKDLNTYYSFIYNSTTNLLEEINFYLSNTLTSKIEFTKDNSSFRISKISTFDILNNSNVGLNDIGFIYNNQDKLLSIIDKYSINRTNISYDNSGFINGYTCGTSYNGGTVIISGVTFNIGLRETESIIVTDITTRNNTLYLKNVSVRDLMGIEYIYNFDSQNKLVSTFEKESNLFYSTFNEDGKLVYSDSGNGINGTTEIESTSSNPTNTINNLTYNFSNIIDLENFESLPNYLYFSLSFYLKHDYINSNINSYISLVIDSNTYKVRVNRYNDSAYEYITIPFKIPKESFVSSQTLSFSLFTSSGIEFDISDLRVLESSTYYLYEFNTQTSIESNISDIILKSSNFKYRERSNTLNNHDIHTWNIENKPLYESDIILNKYIRINETDSEFDLIYDNSKKRTTNIVYLSYNPSGITSTKLVENSLNRYLKERSESKYTINDTTYKVLDDDRTIEISNTLKIKGQSDTNIITKKVIDSFDRIISTIDERGIEEVYEYLGDTDLIRIKKYRYSSTDPFIVFYTNDFDEKGNLVETIDSVNNKKEYTYNEKDLVDNIKTKYYQDLVYTHESKRSFLYNKFNDIKSVDFMKYPYISSLAFNEIDDVSNNVETYSDGKSNYKVEFVPSEMRHYYYIKDLNNNTYNLIYDIKNMVDSNLHISTITERFYNINSNSASYSKTTYYDKYGYLSTINEGNNLKARFTYDLNFESHINKKLKKIEDFYIGKEITLTDDSYSRDDGFGYSLDKTIFKSTFNNYNYQFNNVLDINGKLIGSTVTSTKYNDNVLLPYSVSYIYDNKKRVTQSLLSHLEKTYTYDNLDRVTTETLREETGGLFPNYIYSKYYYAYDSRGNITNIYYSNGNSEETLDSNKSLVSSFVFDSFNRIIEEDGYISRTYSYDNNGRMITSGDNSISYDDKGRMTSFGNKTILYDNYGNTKSKGSNITYGYTRGHLLTTYSNSSNNISLSFSYDYNGIRQSKTVNNSNTHTFYYDNSNRLLFENTSEGLIEYIYSGNSLIGAIFDEHIYRYIKNILGDIIEVRNSEDDIIVEYSYDSFGNQSVTYHPENYYDSYDLTFSHLNPFRYRGYYYDQESELYYLINRYYDPETHRFLTIDSFEYLDIESIGGIDLYAYCGNNPVMYVDPEGNSAIIIGLIIGAIVGAGIGFGTVTYTDYQDDGKAFNGSVKWDEYLIGTLTGTALGACVGGIIGVGGVVLKSALVSTGNKFVADLFAYTFTGTSFGSWEDYAVAFISGGIIKATGASRVIRIAYDVLGRPAINQLVKIGTNRSDTFNFEKYSYDVVTRALTTFAPADWKPIYRGFFKSVWDLYKRGYFHNLLERGIK